MDNVLIQKEMDMVAAVSTFLDKLENKNLINRFGKVCEKCNDGGEGEEIYMLLVQAYVVGHNDGFHELADKLKVKA